MARNLGEKSIQRVGASDLYHVASNTSTSNRHRHCSVTPVITISGGLKDGR